MNIFIIICNCFFTLDTDCKEEQEMELSFIQDENAVELIDGITYAFPYTMHERDLSNYTVPWHWHEEVEFDYAYQGSILVETVNRTYTIHQGEAYFINTNVMNTKRKAEGSSYAVEHAHLFHPILLGGHYKSIFETKYLNPILKNRLVEVAIIKENTESGKNFLRLLHALTRLVKTADAEFEIRNLLSQAWTVLVQEIEVQRRKELFETPSRHERTKDILSFIHKHYQEKITISDISAHAGISEKECIRSFKNTFHQTPTDYLIQYRVEQAKRLLLETDEPVTNIAFMTGFNNSAYFGKTFKKYTQSTPKEFRRSRRFTDL